MSWIGSCSLHPAYHPECGVCIAWALFRSADAPDPQEDFPPPLRRTVYPPVGEGDSPQVSDVCKSSHPTTQEAE